MEFRSPSNHCPGIYFDTFFSQPTPFRLPLLRVPPARRPSPFSHLCR